MWMPFRPCAVSDIGYLRPIRIFKAESFRLAALFALLFLTLTGALIVTVLWIVEGAERNSLLSGNEADIATVTNGFRAEGLDEAVEVVRQRLGIPAIASRHGRHLRPEAYMVIERTTGEVLVGNLTSIACAPGLSTVSLPAQPGEHHVRNVLGRCASLAEGLNLFVGRDTAAMSATRERILHAFAWVALGTCGFAVLVGLFLGRQFMARADAITKTCEGIIAGRLNERIPVQGRGDEWDRLARAINQMLDRISMLLENLQQVSSDVAHDLRTPLTRLRNRLEDARAKPVRPEDYSGVIARAIDDTDQLLSMFSAVLRISQVEAGTRVQSFATVGLSDILERIYELYLPAAEDSRHPLSRNLRPGVSIWGDEELLMQMFSNLLENAIRHTPPGTSICLELTATGDQIVASVIDHGPGVPTEDRDKVVRRFYRGSASRSSEGHGLGLSLAVAIAQLHGASLELGDAKPGLRVAMVIRPAAVVTKLNCS
jgi:signal transduction histidine kinase